MTSLGLFEAKLEAFKMRMDAKLRAFFEEFRLGRSPSLRRSQHGANYDCKKNPSEIRSEDKTWQPYTSTTSISFILRTFIEGLKPEIQEEVQARQPYTLKAVISFARLHEDRLKQVARRTKVVARPAAQRLSAPSTTSRSPQPKMLTREEFRDRSAKGLCWHCNKLWSRDHHCKKDRPLLDEPTEEPKLKDMALESEEKDRKEKPQSAARTFHAPLQILDIDGFIKHQPITILADTRSSNDFMNDKRKQCSLISGYFHDFTEERTMMLKVFPDDDLGSTAYDRKKEQEKGIRMTPTIMMSSISMLALPKRGNVFVLGADTSRVRIGVTLMQDSPWHERGVSPKELQSMLTPTHAKKKWPSDKLQNGRKIEDQVFLHLQPDQQETRALRKWSPYFFGSCKIGDRIEALTWRSDPCTRSRLQLIRWVSHLK
ncbi:hypothetical protein BHM03_00008014 [Ensete ventricosum]|nr:hypothetical protein BHM03_00008014 [Ensete ventricosum]